MMVHILVQNLASALPIFHIAKVLYKSGDSAHRAIETEL